MKKLFIRRRILSLMASALMLAMLLSVSAAAAEGFDMATFRNNPDVFVIDVDAEKDLAYITTNTTVKDRSFTHENESGVRYSCTQFDILVLDYFNAEQLPIQRLWITYCADEFLYINSVTFEVGGVKYTFSGVADPEWLHTFDDGIVEQVLIKLGDDNLEFLAALESETDTLGYIDSLDAFAALDITMTLHGTKDVTVKLGKGFWVDFALIKKGFIRAGGLDEKYLSQADCTPMKIH